jgi:hypothetical protein
VRVDNRLGEGVTMAIENTQDARPLWYRLIEMLPTDVCVGAPVAVELLVGSFAVFDTAPIGRLFGVILVVLSSVYGGAYFGRLRQVIEIERGIFMELGISTPGALLLRLDRSRTEERRRQIMVVLLIAPSALWLACWLAYSKPFGMWGV